VGGQDDQRQQVLALEPTGTCYYGQGNAGGTDISACVDSDAIKTFLAKGFGVDGCLSAPFGGLLVKRPSKFCKDFGFMKLVDKNGDDVVMFK
jgi:hypothetical protein